MTNVLDIDDYNLEEALKLVQMFGSERFGYVVTPNVDHVIRHYHDTHFRSLYEQATYVLLDSRFLAHTVGLVKRQVLRVCFHTDVRNDRSRAALERLGASNEGVLRAHRLAADFTPRDSVRYSIVAAEWPSVRARLGLRLQSGT